ncbi:SDR family NAD(P)-dependent oxidoreductase [Glycomyces harbinensis]|uniref:NAD(P)-dependent dehydrogenase, short-chain alcohol dehydrogenase family n=1 Tax=Glycomyces harbinensis TaxID=58114 RepID=A0A1G7A8Z3_9ACTN|nr:SDR family oxidoreductase [Glycomyces harbinensis]SDE11241.1 NAD(P)-dependent dehydrogenase, short-chain alcohol dehydrogenase family [Glycomyces harbinensis]
MPIAIVTGGSSGIGRSAAVQLAERGWGVIVTYTGSRERGLETVAAVEKAGTQAVALPLDLGRTEEFPEFKRQVVAALADTWGATGVAALVNNGGRARMAPFADTTEELFDDLTRVLLKGPYFLTQAFLPLIEDGGAIVNTTSSSATSSEAAPGYSVYASLKGGLIVLTRFMAKEFSDRGIRVNAIAPGPTRTRLGDNAFERFPELAAPLADDTALGRIGEPDDVGAAIAALCSDESRWITAQSIEVSGGYKL